ncbi:MAG: type II toxin-antitoxin system RnlB family antitoxin, partial [Ureaplasma sp.]|nr:type II toxin-antitoxin system RnlB family antitoxin [Ureaplasma sp.]
LSLVNNNYNRFSKIEFINNKLDFKNAKHIDLNKTYKEITSNFFYNNRNLLENILIIKENKEKIINKEIV